MHKQTPYKQAAGDPTADQEGTDLSAVRDYRIVTLHRHDPFRGFGALPLTHVDGAVDNYDADFGTIFLRGPLLSRKKS